MNTHIIKIVITDMSLSHVKLWMFENRVPKKFRVYQVSAFSTYRAFARAVDVYLNHDRATASLV